MLRGEELWDARVTAGLTTANVRGHEFVVYEDAPTSLYTSLVASAVRAPDSVALIADDGRTATFSQLRMLVDQAATCLERRVRPGTRVALLLDTSIEFAVALYAVNRCGGVAVPVPTKHRAPEMRALLDLAEPELIIAEERFRDWDGVGDSTAELLWSENRDDGYGFGGWGCGAIPTPPRQADPDADCLLMYTSGTTSVSKGVLLTNRGVGHAIAAYRHVLGIGPGDSSVLPVPIAYVTGLVALLGLFVHVGGALHLHRRFDADRLLRTLEQERITFVHASPTVYALLLDAAARRDHPPLPALRMMACGAAHMPVSRIRELHAWLPRMEFRTVYGLTETSSPALIFPADAATSVHCGSSGRPIPGLQLQVRDEAGREAERGEPGALWLRGANLLRRYDGIETPSLTEDGWLDTGDVGYIGDDDYVFLVDRTKDMINRGGEKVWCIDVEEALRRIDGIADAAVVGAPDELYGEVPVALIVPGPGGAPSHQRIVEQLSETLARYQLPVRFLVREEMPLTQNLKVDKRAVRELFASA